MWNEPTEERLMQLPRLYTTEETTWQNKIIHEHFFIFDCDWYMAEYSPQERNFFGYAILNGDLNNSEWGYINFDEMRDIRVNGIEVDRDLHWRVRQAGEVEKIVEAHG